MRLDIESLRALRAVVDAGSFTEAAARLGMTQSAVSWKIKRLEERAGLDLVKRGSEIEATPDGSDLLAYADRMIEAHDAAVEHLSRSDLHGVVRLGTNEDLSGGPLAEVLAGFGRMYPHIRLDVRVHLSGVVAEWLDDGQVDLAVLQTPVGDLRPDDLELWRAQLGWYRGIDFPSENSEVPVVSFGPGLAYLEAAEASLDRAAVTWRHAIECPMLSGVRAAVEAGLGIAALHPANVSDLMVEWENPKAQTLPEIAEVIRTGTTGYDDVIDRLRDTLAEALRGRDRLGALTP